MTRRRVLLIDDSATIAARVRLALGSDYELRVASGPWDALLEAQRFPPDVIILDLGLTTIGGEVLAVKLRETGCKAPIVIYTSASPSAAEHARVRLSAAKCLDKTCTDQELRTAVAIALLKMIYNM